MIVSSVLLLFGLGTTPDIVNVGRSVELQVGGALWQSGPWTVFLEPDGGTLDVFDSETRTLSSTGLPVAVSDFGFPLREALLLVAGRYGIFLVDEQALGQDLNGDGLTDDAVLHLIDLQLKQVHATGFAAPTNSAALWNRMVLGANPGDGDYLAFTVLEYLVGDLNGDGDALDEVAHVLDATTGEIRNLGLDHGFGAAAVVGNDVYVSVREANQGQVDLNTDGDLEDWILHRHHVPTNTTKNLGVAGYGGRGNLFIVSELWEGADLNGDGLIQDFVWHTLNPANDSFLGLGLVPFGFGTAGITSQVEEEDGIHLVLMQEADIQLGVDINADGDLLDFTGLLWDAETRRLMRTGLELVFPLVMNRESEGVRLAVIAPETSTTGDLNGDGDTLDRVLRVRSEDGSLQTAPWALQFAITDTHAAAFDVSEADHGADLDGDGQLSSTLAVVHDFTNGSSRLLRWSGAWIVRDGLVWALRSEAVEGLDLNEDGDTADTVLFSLDIATGQITNYGLTVADFLPVIPLDASAFSDQAIAVVVREEDEDLNMDGDVLDDVLHVVVR